MTKNKINFDTVTSLLYPLIFGLCILFLWQSGILHTLFKTDQYILPYPTRIFRIIAENSDKIMENVQSSMIVIIIGLIFGSLIGYLAAIFATLSPNFGKGGLTVISAFNAIPIEAGICINNSSVTIVHGMSRPIGALFHVPHGTSNAMLLEKCMDFAKSGALDKFADLARAVGAADTGTDNKTAAGKFIEGLGNLCRLCNIPGIEEYGIDKDKFIAAIPKMAHDALASGSPGNTQKKVTEEDIKEIYRSLI